MTFSRKNGHFGPFDILYAVFLLLLNYLTFFGHILPKFYGIFMKFLNINLIFIGFFEKKWSFWAIRYIKGNFSWFDLLTLTTRLGVNRSLNRSDFWVPSLVLSHILIFCKQNFDWTTWFDIKMTFWKPTFDIKNQKNFN